METVGWKDRLRNLVCAVFRHSNLEDSCWGYVSCARCGAQLGDTLAGCYSNSRQVGISCDCTACRENLKRLTFIDTFLAKKPEWIGEPPGYSKRKKEEARIAMDELIADWMKKK